jgi:L-lactate dehydrogenase (cytochrome)
MVMSRGFEVERLRSVARGKLPKFLFEYLDGAALDEQTLAANARDMAAIGLRQRVLCDVSSVSTGTALLGQTISMPLGLSPVGMAGMYARRGEAQAAQAAALAGVPFTLSTVSICDLAEVQAASGTPAWFQLYITRDREFMRDAIARAASLGASALVVTVDMPVPGIRYRDRGTGLSAPAGWARDVALYAQALARPGWAWDVGLHGQPHMFGTVAASAAGDFGLNRFWSWMSDSFDPTVTLADVEVIRSLWSGPLIIKGVMAADDARDVVRAGADGIVVSNHGGRQLDGTLSTIAALPRVREAVGDAVTVLMDGGVRSGVDVFRAIASGADAAMIGRPWVYALASGGQASVSALLSDFYKELHVTMALTGARSIKEIGSDCLEQLDRRRG